MGLIVVGIALFYWFFLFQMRKWKILALAMLLVVSSLPLMYALEAHGFITRTERSFTFTGAVPTTEGFAALMEENDGDLWCLVYRNPPKFKQGARFTDKEFSVMYADNKALIKRGIISGR
jgi:hypothetical protein